MMMSLFPSPPAMLEGREKRWLYYLLLVLNMLFNSFPFIFIFLPLVLFGYYSIAKISANPTYRLAFLAVASLIFYSYWDITFLPIISISIACNYIFGLLIGNKSITDQHSKILFIIAVLLNLAALAFYKYINFGINILNHVAHANLQSSTVLLPLGISFFTFTQIAYLADVLSGHTSEKNLIKYTLFVTYFPHLIAGPIIHHKEMMPQFHHDKLKKINIENIVVGLSIFVMGLFKKVIIADGFGMIADPVFSVANHTIVLAMDAIGAALAYTLQIYFDFSGYSDMAIGLSLMFGILLPFNFNMPYKARSMIEFWQRWHITLSRFLREYLYIKLGGNRRGKIRRYMNLMITMFLGGLWHGAGWTFVVWGLLHGIYLVINHGWRHIVNTYPFLVRYTRSVIYPIFSLIVTQFFVVLAWIYFRAEHLRSADRLVKSIFTFHHAVVHARPHLITNIEFILIAFVYILCLLMPNIKTIFGSWNVGLVTYQHQPQNNLLSLKWNMSARWAIAIAVLFLISLLFILAAGDGSRFLYFQF